MMRSAMLFALALLAPALCVAQARTSKTLDVYVIDVEGGNAVLYISPSGESLLMDTGNVGAVAAARDAGRIGDAAKEAGLQPIGHLITTHWPRDHLRGI